MKRLMYTVGPGKVTMGIAGLFRRGEPREVEDGLAEGLLKKSSIKFELVPAGSKKDSRSESSTGQSAPPEADGGMTEKKRFNR